jgi:hypothetical protein
MGPLSITWIEEQRKLQKKIVKRMREFQMTPILPAFSGLVGCHALGQCFLPTIPYGLLPS